MKLTLVVFIISIGSFTIFSAPSNLLFDGHSLTLPNPNTNQIQSWKAGSGRPFSTEKDQSQKNKGPIPEGVYTIRLDQSTFFNQTSHLKSKIKWLLNYIAWGDLAIPLEPADSNTIYGRHSFMIHGGGWLIGSKGCIYVYSKSEEIHQILKKYPDNLKLVVHYEQ